MCSGKGSLKKISGSSECFSSVIPRSLLRGASIPINQYRSDNPLNPINEYNPTTPFRPLNFSPRPSRQQARPKTFWFMDGRVSARHCYQRL